MASRSTDKEKSSTTSKNVSKKKLKKLQKKEKKQLATDYQARFDRAKLLINLDQTDNAIHSFKTLIPELMKIIEQTGIIRSTIGTAEILTNCYSYLAIIYAARNNPEAHTYAQQAQLIAAELAKKKIELTGKSGLQQITIGTTDTQPLAPTTIPLTYQTVTEAKEPAQQPAVPASVPVTATTLTTQIAPTQLTDYKSHFNEVEQLIQEKQFDDAVSILELLVDNLEADLAATAHDPLAVTRIKEQLLYCYFSLNQIYLFKNGKENSLYVEFARILSEQEPQEVSKILKTGRTISNSNFHVAPRLRPSVAPTEGAIEVQVSSAFKTPHNPGIFGTLPQLRSTKTAVGVSENKDGSGRKKDTDKDQVEQRFTFTS